MEISDRARELAGHWLWFRELARQEGGWYCDLPASGDHGEGSNALAEHFWSLLVAEAGSEEAACKVINKMLGF